MTKGSRPNVRKKTLKDVRTQGMIVGALCNDDNGLSLAERSMFLYDSAHRLFPVLRWRLLRHKSTQKFEVRIAHFKLCIKPQACLHEICSSGNAGHHCIM